MISAPSTPADLDGLRVDAVKHVEEIATRNLAAEVREAFEHGARMRAYGEAMCRLAERRTADLRRDQQVTVHEVAQQISLDMILQATR
ncbi:hypothetical protein ACMHYB_21610 [Sorangium sp. So ce1128]